MTDQTVAKHFGIGVGDRFLCTTSAELLKYDVIDPERHQMRTDLSSVRMSVDFQRDAIGEYSSGIFGVLGPASTTSDCRQLLRAIKYS
jgi:hypothetical protein